MVRNDSDDISSVPWCGATNFTCKNMCGSIGFYKFEVVELEISELSVLRDFSGQSLDKNV